MDDRALLVRLAAGPASGDLLAREAGTSRTAVWKRIEALRAAGVDIAAQAGVGYSLERPLDLLDADTIRAHLTPAATEELALLEVAWSIDSTNTELLRRNKDLRPEGVEVLLAERQTGGRGRRGRAWASPLAAHLYLSVARQFGGGLARLGGLSLVAGVAVAEALHACGHRDVRLKWPNDLVVEQAGGLRKLGGLLVEGGGEHGGPVRAVIGIGLNVHMPEAFARDIDQPWCDLDALGGTHARNAIASAVLSRLLPALADFDRDGLEPFLVRYAPLDALAGRAIDVHLHDGTATAVAEGLAPDGALRVRLDDGAVRVLHSGEVSVRMRGA